MDKRVRLKWIVNEESILLRDFLKNNEISKRSLTHIKYEGGEIKVNGLETTVRNYIHRGDRVEVAFPLENRSPALLPEMIELEVLYEDDDVLVINKPPYMNSIPSRGHTSGSIANAIAGLYDRREYHGAVHIATRLDRDTSGLMLIAKHAHAHHLIGKLQKQHKVKRSYLAVIHGEICPSWGTVSAPIGRKSTSIIEREVREDGQHAVTNYQLLGQNSLYSSVELSLETGRTHQIRVHMNYLGHPIVGDDLYGGKRDVIQRQALHSRELTFLHPFTQKELRFEAEPPEDILSLMKGWNS
ncbi:RluA family pseudouridine synthase [Jeotgalibacillus sp. ET6]|uniref:RluA family pseudouridine synthase n=1 Tax=Jeotgalibacillus sp. ET6 TaxID=3037260 RepID=UPI0024184F46|nr:RluA family pseudouridine synthase [Jeotgalibacillus sp. ET6]MDG5473006.1 RluA family pseudouridine synthase [Jeotgalibacillus sp. ET6]